jgi:ABC-type Fe3+ transport system permease subunit
MHWVLIGLLLLIGVGSDICAALIVNEIAESNSHWALQSWAAFWVSVIAAAITAFVLVTVLVVLNMSSTREVRANRK